MLRYRAGCMSDESRQKGCVRLRSVFPKPDEGSSMVVIFGDNGCAGLDLKKSGRRRDSASSEFRIGAGRYGATGHRGNEESRKPGST